jgi:hypothetical protein
MSKVLANIAAVALVLIPAIAHADASEPVSFRHEGQTYTYTAEQVGNKKVLRGHMGPSNEPFVLNVANRWVTGTVNGSPVSFSLKSVKRVRGIVIMDQMAVR